jgi:hypothetical protein
MLAKRQGVLTSTGFNPLLPSLNANDTDPGSMAGLNLPATSFQTDASVCIAVTLALTRCSAGKGKSRLLQTICPCMVLH